jgi:hypothetical protein
MIHTNEEATAEVSWVLREARELMEMFRRATAEDESEAYNARYDAYMERKAALLAYIDSTTAR